MAVDRDQLATVGMIIDFKSLQDDFNLNRFVTKISLSEAENGNLVVSSNDHTHELLDTNSDLNADNIKGIIGIDHIPQAALERVVRVENSQARFALTENDIQLGDVVKEEDSGNMFFVVDVTNLNNSEGYMAFASGSAASVAWSGVTDKPNTFPASAHTHDGSEIITAVANATNAVNAEVAAKVGSITVGAINQPVYLNEGIPTACNFSKADIGNSLSISGNTLTLQNSVGNTLSSVELPESSSSGSPLDPSISFSEDPKYGRAVLTIGENSYTLLDESSTFLDHEGGCTIRPGGMAAGHPTYELSASSSDVSSTDQITSLEGFQGAWDDTYDTWDNIADQARQKLEADPDAELTEDESNAYYGYVTIPYDPENPSGDPTCTLNELLSYIMWMLDARVPASAFMELGDRISALENGSGNGSGSGSSDLDIVTGEELLEYFNYVPPKTLGGN